MNYSEFVDFIKYSYIWWEENNEYQWMNNRSNQKIQSHQVLNGDTKKSNTLLKNANEELKHWRVKQYIYDL